jgi:hypothetical protein
VCPDNQEVGLEAAILQRVRNSSLVECAGADNGPGLRSRRPRPWLVRHPGTAKDLGSGAGVGERPQQRRRWTREGCWSAAESECRHE